MKLTTSILTRGHRASSTLCIVHCALCIMVNSALADVTIADITARQRWPWNGLIDIDFTIAGAAAGETFAIDIDATADNGAKALLAKTYASEPVAGTGANRVVWDLGADYPEFRANDLRISVTATPLSDSTPVYMVIDLSGGSTATKYPVRYTTTPPAHVQGAANEPCQTTELWMRRVTPVSYAFRANFTLAPTTGNITYMGKLTKPYYVGVFELTQKQYSLITGAWPAYFTNMTYRASRPLENVNYKGFTGSNEDIDLYPETIGANSPLGKLRAKTGLPLNLPTDLEWEFAARGGWGLTGGEYYRYGNNGVYYGWADIARYKGTVANTSPGRDSDAASGTAVVGSYLPNGYGLYDVQGNVKECLSAHQLYNSNYRAYYQELTGDDTLGMTAANPIIDPKGTPKSLANGGNSVYRRVRGGSWDDSSDYISMWYVSAWESGDSSNGSTYYTPKNRVCGFRLSMRVE